MAVASLLHISLWCSYQLDVEATDGGIPRRIGVTQIVIRVVNINDNSPRFDRSFYAEEVREGKCMHKTAHTKRNCIVIIILW